MMTTLCPNNHPSASDDYCDQCGTPMEPDHSHADCVRGESVELSPPVTQFDPCPRCRADRFGDDDPFCELCGHRFGHEPTLDARNGQWELIIAADRDQYERSGATNIAFPEVLMTRVVALFADEVRIGRRSASRKIDPDIDLSTEPEDLAISHMHAVLVRQSDGSYAVCDLGSTNGTTINDETSALAANQLRPLADGDRIHLGTWTTLTVRCRP